MADLSGGSRRHAVLDAALELAREGFPVFPCRRDKRPATPRGFYDAAVDEAEIRRLWRFCPGPLIGVSTGESSGFDVLDVDPRHGGDEWLNENTHRLYATRIHETQSGGFHLLFIHRRGLRCSTGKVARGLDVRADAGYAIWWPASGLPVLNDAPIDEWPEWLLSILMTAPRPSPVAFRGRVPDRRQIEALVRTVALAREGDRNSVTFWAACRLGEMVRTRLLDEGRAIALITEAAARSGLEAREAERTAASGLARGLRDGGHRHAAR